MISKLFPSICVNCKKEGDFICESCKKKLEPHPHICPYCHKYSQDGKTCFTCKNTKSDVFLDGMSVCFSYNNLIKKCILKLKYYHKKSVANFLAGQLEMNFHSNLSLINQINSQHGDVLVAGVPSHWVRRFFVKGYNQSFILAKKLANKLGFKYKKVVYKTKNTKSQVSLGRLERQENVKDVFSLYSKLNGDETIIIVDDITTTGSTINEMAKTIKSIYPNIIIRGIVIARHNH